MTWDLCGELGPGQQAGLPLGTFHIHLGCHPQAPHSWITPSCGERSSSSPLYTCTPCRQPHGQHCRLTQFPGIKKPRTWVSLALALFCPAAASRAGIGAIALLEGRQLVITTFLEEQRKAKAKSCLCSLQRDPALRSQSWWLNHSLLQI